MGLLRALRSFLAVLAALFLLAVVSPTILYLYVIPRRILQPTRGQEFGVAWVSWNARMLVALFRAGGAKISVEGRIDSSVPGIIVMNHQSVLDIPPMIEVLGPRLPRFVARSRYARFIPTVSQAIAFIDCIVVNPRRDRAGAVLALKKAAEERRAPPVLLFPEGHRTRDGEIGQFRPAGTIALLQAGPVPVWTVVVDGFWKLRRVVDSFFGLGRVRARIRVVECVMSPENPEDLADFVEARRGVMIRELARMRAEEAR